MATSWAEICAAAMIPIDDLRLQEQMEISPALYYRRMSLLITNAIPMLNSPPELLNYIVNGMVAPQYGEYAWVSTEASTSEQTTIETGMIGFDICSCVIVEQLTDGRVMQTPYAVEYDKTTGNVVFPVQSAAGVSYELDFYTDGSFNDLSPSQIRLFALAISLIWDERFTSNWLARQPKINDSSFATVNEANWTEKQSQAHRRKAQDFYDELKAYEQFCAYQTRVGNRIYTGVTWA